MSTKLQLNVAYHTKGDPYPEHDFSYLKDIDISSLSKHPCYSNRDIVEKLEAQYNKNSKLTKGEYFYYTIFVEHDFGRNICE